MKIIKIMWKIALAFVAAGYDGAVKVDASELIQLLPVDIQETLNRELLLYETMLDAMHTDDELRVCIQDLKDYIKRPENRVPEAYRKKWRQQRYNLSKYLNVISENLPLHRGIRRQIRRIEVLLNDNEPCYGELRHFIASALRFPIYQKEAREFRKELVLGQMNIIESIMEAENVEAAGVIAKIQSLMDFIKEEDSLNYKDKYLLGKLQSIRDNFDSHREVYTNAAQLCRQLYDIRCKLRKDQIVEGVQEKEQQARRDFEVWKELTLGFGDQYAQKLRALQRLFAEVELVKSFITRRG